MMLDAAGDDDTAMQEHSLHQAVLGGGVRTHGGVRGRVPRSLVGSN